MNYAAYKCNYYVVLFYQYYVSYTCSHYQIAVVILPNDELPERAPSVQFPHQDSFFPYNEVPNIISRPVAYIASEFSDEEFPANRQFVIGDHNQPNDLPAVYTNGPLRSGKYYTFFLRAYPKLGVIQKRAPVSPVCTTEQ